MGGVIGVESSVGVGSVFWFELNSVDEPHYSLEAGERSRPSVQQNQRSPLTMRTLLYVEDNPASLKLVEIIITRHSDIHLLVANSGCKGIEIARNALPDVILMDINLPDINGFEALKMLRLDLSTAHIPVIALSANAMPNDIKKGLDLGFFRYITKPIKIHELMDAVDIAFESAGIQPNTRV